eukprot:4997329-Prymnesium_polylepis.1
MYSQLSSPLRSRSGLSSLTDTLLDTDHGSSVQPPGLGSPKMHGSSGSGTFDVSLRVVMKRIDGWSLASWMRRFPSMSFSRRNAMLLWPEQTQTSPTSTSTSVCCGRLSPPLKTLSE